MNPLFTILERIDVRFTVFRAKFNRDLLKSKKTAKLFFKLVDKGKTSKIKFLLEKGVLPDIQGEFKIIPLHLAAFHGHIDIVKELLKRSTKINERGDESQTPLHVAAFYGHEEIVSLLLKKGADPNILDQQGRTPLDVAVKRDHVGVVDRLLKDHRVDLNIPGRCGYPLHVAAKYGYISVVELLLKQPGIDLNAKDREGCTPLHLAIKNGREDIRKRLEESTKLKNNKVQTAIDLVRQNAHPGISKNEPPRYQEVIKNPLIYKKLERVTENSWNCKSARGLLNENKSGKWYKRRSIH